MSKPENGENEKIGSLAEDLSILTRTQLKEKYRAEYNSWRNGKQRSKIDDNWSPEFDDFANFLRLLGPCPRGHTLDRLNVKNPMYAPGLVRWASKRDQANNRTSTRFVTHAGETQPLAEAARTEGITPSAARQRFRRSHTEESAFRQMIEDFGCGIGGDPRLFKPWPRHRDNIAAQWEEFWKRQGGYRPGNSRYDFFIRQLQKLVAEIEVDLDHLQDTGVPRTDPRWNEFFDSLGRSRNHLRRALNEKPEWERVVRLYELRKKADKNERDALKSNNYLNFEGGDLE